MTRQSWQLYDYGGSKVIGGTGGNDRILAYEAGKDDIDLDNLKMATINQIVVSDDISEVTKKQKPVVSLEFKSGANIVGSIKLDGFDPTHLIFRILQPHGGK